MSAGTALRLSESATTLVLRPFPRMQIRNYSKFDIFGNLPIPANKRRLVPASGTYPKGFVVGGVNVGINQAIRSRPDLVLVASEKPSCGAAVFTKNEFPAASVTVSRELLRQTRGHGIRGVIANAQCANTFTGFAGLQDTVAMSQEAGKYVVGDMTAEQDSSMLVMHTGAGCQRLPIDQILWKIPELYQGSGGSHERWLEAAKGICTTDTFPKLASRTFTLPSAPDITYSLAGITKGAGMVHPNMATTLGIVCTDAPVTPVALQQLLAEAASTSFNNISIDGDTSTNDMVALLANGAAGGAPIDLRERELPSPGFVALQHVLNTFLASLAQLVVRDAQGASRFAAIRVRGAPSAPAARCIAAAIARSVLVKTGLAGRHMPNWATVHATLGYALLDTPFEGQGIIAPDRTSVSFGPDEQGELIKFLDRETPTHVDEGVARRIMEQDDIEVVVDLRDDEMGAKYLDDAVYWTSDLTHQFVAMNSDGN